MLDGDPAPLPHNWHSLPQFSVNICCGKTAGWIKMPLGTEVSLGPGDIVLDGGKPAPQKMSTSPIFSPCLLWPNGWMDQDATWYDEARSRPRRHCYRWRPSSPHGKWHSSPPPSLFGPCLLWPNGRPSQQLHSCTLRFVFRSRDLCLLILVSSDLSWL